MPSRETTTSDTGRDATLRLVLITGLSGSGKSTAAKAFEDIGYFCVDNLPLPLLRAFLAEPLLHVGDRRRIAVVTDVRAPGFAEIMPSLVEDLRDVEYELIILFMEAREESLVRRFSETRRPHPLGEGERPLIEGIRRERELLADLRARADLVFDTTDWSVHDVRREIIRELSGGAEGDDQSLAISLASFGFKHGIPYGTDLLFDVRFLSNPHFQPGLREQTGQDADVLAFLEAQDDFDELLSRLESLLLFLLPRYRDENRSYLSIGIGCTGGRHRSVAVTERLAARLETQGWAIRTSHRDLDR
ncbi:MAG: RNase adapter RapZ [Acidobacteriota bacterium]